MYILIDCDKLVFRHAHASVDVIHSLAHIEVSHCATYITPIVPNVLDSFSMYELERLYENTTGDKWVGFSRPHLVAALFCIMCALPESDASPLDARAQASKITLEDRGFYKYIKGSQSAAKMQDLFVPPALTAKAPAPGEVAAVRPDPIPVAATARTPAIVAPAGGNRGTVFEVADRIWEQAGKPSELTTVLQLRRTIMSVLESEHGIKKTTSSTALGGWQKLRLNN